MTAASFVSPATADRINAAARRGFATRMALGPTVDLLLYRDDDANATATQVGPQTVLLTLAKREATPVGNEAGGFVGSDGEFARGFPFDAQIGDRFKLPGGTGTATVNGRITAVAPVRNGVVRAAFVLEG